MSRLSNLGFNVEPLAFLRYFEEAFFLDDECETTMPLRYCLHARPYLNCRERGFVLSYTEVVQPLRNWAFFGHRNSGSLCVVEWTPAKGEGSGPKEMLLDVYTTEDIPSEVYPDAHSVTKSWEDGDFGKAGEWLYGRLEDLHVEVWPERKATR